MAEPIDERKLATVLFADLVGSTALASDQDPERTRARLERFYAAMAAEIEAAGGTVEKFAGDAVMAAFGVPVAHEDHAERALHAALSMQRRLDALFGDGLALRIGVNTGEVVVGRPRAGSSFVSGDPVNVAARLEQGAAAGEILVGERTVAAVRGAFEFSEPCVVEAKGKSDGVTARRLVRSLSLMRPRGVRGLRSAFVGRDRELGRLLDSHRTVAERDRPKLVTVIGDAGVGKTRLLRELWERLDDEEPPPIRRTGRTLPYGRGITYWPLGEVLKEHLGIQEGDSPAEVRARLGEEEILGLTLGLDVAGDLHPLAARDRLHEAWIGFFESLTRERPVVVLVEDIHWAEDPLLDLVERLARDVDGPLLLVATARPDFADRRSSWASGRVDAETLWLDPLVEDSTRELVDELLAHDLPTDLRDRIVAKTEGNPFFVEEILGTLIDRGLLVPQNGGWVAGELEGDVALPDSVQAVLAARIDLLDPVEKEALQAAAVIGRTFWTGPVYDLLEGAEPDLRVLEDRDFIRRRSGSTLEGEVEYAFKHALTRQVAYDGLTKARRARLHARFAEWLERTVGDDLAALLAHHYAEAVRPEDVDLAWSGDDEHADRLRERAIYWLHRAGDLALSRYELEDAIVLFSRALELEPDVDEQLDLYEALGRAHSFRFDGEPFWEAMQNALDRTTDRERQAALYTTLVCETVGRSGMWKRLPDSELIESWVRRAVELSEPDSVTRWRALLGGYWFKVVDAKTADEAAGKLLESGDVFGVIEAMDTRKLLAFRAGDYEAALHWSIEELAAADAAGDPEQRQEVREATIAVFALCGRLDEADRLLDEYYQIVEALSPHHRLHAVALELEIEEVRADWEHVLELLPRTRRAVVENVDTPCIRHTRSLLISAAAAASLGEEKLSEELEAEANAAESHGFEEIVRGPRLRLALVRGDLSAARELTVSPLVVRRQVWFFPGAVAAYFDALAALDYRERAEEDAAKFGAPGTVLEAFALRTLGVVRSDEELLARAANLFEALQLARQAEQTRALG